jgi:hypothetical protein
MQPRSAISKQTSVSVIEAKAGGIMLRIEKTPSASFVFAALGKASKRSNCRYRF